MDLTHNDIKWGSYDKYEGPYWPGRNKFVLPAQPDFMDKALYTVTATEGGCLDSVNMYDRCILSVGLIQWCEAGQFSVSTLLGRCAEIDPDTFYNTLKKFPFLVRFYKSAMGNWRFVYKNVEVATPEMQRALFLGGSTGLKNEWNPEQKRDAKDVAAWFANFWNTPLFARTQAEYTKLKLSNFIMPQPRAFFTTNSTFGYQGAMYAAYFSFACNNPSIAAKSFTACVADETWTSLGSEEARCISLLRHLTFAPNIKIYPGRYEKLAPVLNRLFGINLPLKAVDLGEELNSFIAPNTHEKHHIDLLNSQFQVSEIEAIDKVEEHG